MSKEKRKSWRLSISSLPGAAEGQELCATRETTPSPPISTSHKRWSLTSHSSKSTSLHAAPDGSFGPTLERTISSQPPSIKEGSKSGFHKSLSSMMGGIPGFSNLSLSRTSTKESVSHEDPRGRSMSNNKHKRSSSHAPPTTETPSRSQSRARSQSPFSFRRFRSQRDSSPVPPLPLSSTSSEVSLLPPDGTPSPNIRPRTAFTDDADYDTGDETETGETDGEYTEDEYSGDEFDVFDDLTERNTERNAVVEPPPSSLGLFDPDADIDPDPLGEGVNVVVPPEPYFPSTIHSMPTRTSSTSAKAQSSTSEKYKAS
ncbi:hypothetical protein BT96DRAFT_444356 [Gymnopus androsaceus JB14]|uniref:Uncharacterized protein n=1 Tax=Gymnopus androsaceus JB14 TaxID=1447944 RepID=A0A6A4I1W1_9AGAR|nr:hypothetical protein BT96DRAFT_444356 [Gymnopus androsaceus JB14]